MNIIKRTFQISDLPLNEIVKQDLKCIVCETTNLIKHKHNEIYEINW